LPALVERAEVLAGAFRGDLRLNASVVETTTFLGGGSVPLEPLPTAAVRLAAPLPGQWPSEGAFARALRLGDPPVVARLKDGAVLFDLRAVAPPEDALLLEAVRRLVEDGREAD
jgi:L-seryl-tRNA(Ser) seleniumtransferase